MIRPEARKTLWRWREALAGGGIAALGLWLSTGFGLIRWGGWLLAALGMAIAIMGAQRAVIRSRHGGPGHISLDEGQLSYFGPISGGIVDVTSITRVDLDPSGKPLHWRLFHPAGPPLTIPSTADGHDALIDGLATLPGFSVARAVRALTHPPDHNTTIWRDSDEPLD